ncbi:MAG: Enterochelin esterase [Flaviaesturariibacter sp.]|nr:Enterochelin esterase [Flaviaesturariibacter sp.]
MFITGGQVLQLIFGAMQMTELSVIVVERKLIYSTALRRYVTVEFYLPKNISNPSELSLLLINDGQDLPKMQFGNMLNELLEANKILPVLCVGIYAGAKRMLEYGTANVLDFKSRGSRAAAYSSFIIDKLIPYIHSEYCIESFLNCSVAGFSLGGLTAIDMAWNHPEKFSIAGVFSGSLWWRTKDLDDGYDEETDRIMHRQVKEGNSRPGQRFYFTTGSLDETADRNGNGIIDSIDDTTDLVKNLKDQGIPDKDIVYINYEDGKHDVETWGRAMPHFLQWGWGRKEKLPILI